MVNCVLHAFCCLSLIGKMSARGLRPQEGRSSTGMVIESLVYLLCHGQSVSQLRPVCPMALEVLTMANTGYQLYLLTHLAPLKHFHYHNFGCFSSVQPWKLSCSLQFNQFLCERDNICLPSITNINWIFPSPCRAPICKTISHSKARRVIGTSAASLQPLQGNFSSVVLNNCICISL